MKWFSVLFFMLALNFELFAEKIYLKGGRIIEAIIMEEKNDSIMIEIGNRWQKINKKNIIKIIDKSGNISDIKLDIAKETIEDKNTGFKNKLSWDIGLKAGVFIPTGPCYWGGARDLMPIFYTALTQLSGKNHLVYDSRLKNTAMNFYLKIIIQCTTHGVTQQIIIIALNKNLI